MKEFISILISFIFMSVASNIDSAFNNLISIDVIVACGSFLLIDSIFKSISEIGIYTYRTVREHEWTYLWFNIIFSVLTAVIVFIFKEPIINIFHLTVQQKSILSNILIIYIIYLPIGRLANALFEIIRLKGKLKIYRNSLIVYYVSLIGLDFLAYISTGNVILLFIATIISWVISTIYMLYKLKLKFELPTTSAIKNIVKYGLPFASERLFSMLFLLLYGILASNLGTEQYSIHTICYSVCLSLELITNAYQATLMIKVPEGKTYKEQYQKCMNMKKRCFGTVIVLNFIFAFIYLFISHGSLPIQSCFPYILFYSFGVFGLYQYETYKTLCITQGKTLILLFGSTFGVIIRFVLCLLFINTSFALFIFGIVNCIDFYSRSIVYRYFLRKLN